nr:hypothetical protein SUGSMm_21680 [Morganella morganii subsp. sibonii]
MLFDPNNPIKIKIILTEMVIEKMVFLLTFDLDLNGDSINFQLMYDKNTVNNININMTNREGSLI